MNCSKCCSLFCRQWCESELFHLLSSSTGLNASNRGHNINLYQQFFFCVNKERKFCQANACNISTLIVRTNQTRSNMAECPPTECPSAFIVLEIKQTERVLDSSYITLNYLSGTVGLSVGRKINMPCFIIAFLSQ